MSEQESNDEAALDEAELPRSESFFNAEDAAELLPAWFLPRMMEEGGLYAVLLGNGATLAVERVERLHLAADGELWLDVMLTPRPGYASDRQHKLVYGETQYPEASLSCRHVAAVYELERPTDD